MNRVRARLLVPGLFFLGGALVSLATIAGVLAALAAGAPAAGPAPSPAPIERVALAARTWVPRPAPAIGKGPMPGGTGKHSRLLFDSRRNRMVLAGGDYMYAEPGMDTRDNFEGMQMVWAIDLSQGANASWVRLKPWCVAPGEIQPARPDTVVWVYDSNRDQGVMLPGFYAGTQARMPPTVCPGVTQVVDAMIYDFAAGKWLRPTWPEPPGGYGGDLGGSFGVFDPVTDAVYRFRKTGWGNTMEILHRATNTWEQIQLGGENDELRSTNANRDQSAIDARGRSIYAISWRLRALTRYSIPDRRVVETVPMPSQWTPPEVPGEHETWLVFDPINRVLLNPVARNFNGALLGLAIYHVDTKRWEWEGPPTGGPRVSGNVVGFDPANNAMTFLGRSPSAVWWLYRYGNGSATHPVSPPRASAPVQPRRPGRPPPDPAAMAVISALGSNSWVGVNPKPRTVYQSAVHSHDRSAPDHCNRPMTSGEPVSRGYSGVAYGDGIVFNFGGGHESHPGNDVDLYFIAANQWVEQYPPECPANGSWEARDIAGAGSAVPTLTPLGRPYTQHTYQQCAYDSRRTRFVCVLASGTWAFDRATASWTLLAGPSVGTFSPDWFIGAGNVAYDPAADRLIAFVADPRREFGRGTHAFDLKTNAWKFVGPFPSNAQFAHAELYSAYNPDRQEFAVVVGESYLFRYRLSTDTWTEVASFPAALKGVLPNFAYDSRHNVMVFLVTPLSGNERGPDRQAQIWVWNPEADTWVSVPTPSSAPKPILWVGKERACFVYDPAQNVFIFLKRVHLYCGLAGYACGGSVKTWAYRYER